MSSEYSSSNLNIMGRVGSQKLRQESKSVKFGLMILKVCFLINNIDFEQVYKLPNHLYQSNPKLIRYANEAEESNPSKAHNHLLYNITSIITIYWLIKAFIFAIIYKCLPDSFISTLEFGIIVDLQVIVARFMLNYHQKNRTFDLSIVRFLYAPERELKCVDSSILNLIDSIYASLKAYESKLLKTFDSTDNINDIRINYIIRLKLLDQMENQLRLAKSSAARLRPLTYSDEGHASVRNFFTWIVNGLYGMHVFYIIAVSSSYFHFTIELMHSFSRMCFNIFVIETYIMMITGIIIYSAHVITIFILYPIQAKQISHSKSNMILCLKALSNINTEIQTATPISTGSRVSLLAQADKLSLDTLMKFMSALSELSRLSDTLTTIMTFQIACMVSVVVGSVLGEASKHPTARLIRILFFLISYVGYYVFVLSCATISARLVELERICWSMVAMNISIMRETAHSIGSHFPETMWRRLTLKFSQSRGIYTPRPFGFRLTYSNTLEQNLYFISIIYLLMVRH